VDQNIVRLIFISVVVFIVSIIARAVRDKFSKPKYEDEVQKPGRLQSFILKLFIFLEVFAVFFAVLGALMGEVEMALVFGVLALIFFAVILVLKREFDTSYQENDEYFILKAKNKKYKVFYEDIIDWQPSYNEIAILDQTKSDRKYIRVNIVIFKPEILLRKIADMAMEGKFNTLDETSFEERGRELETIHYLEDYHYGYLVEDYVQELEFK
jgi:Ca2+/Na+ antiporter